METTTIDTSAERRYSTRERRHGPVDAVLSAFRYRISWGAVIAGAFVGTAVQILLTALGTGIGASAINPAEGGNAMAGLGIGAAVWLFVSTIVAFYVSGWTAGRMSGAVRRSEAGYHGFVNWAFSSVVTTLLVTGALGATIAGIGKAASGSGLGNTIRQELSDRGVDINQPPQAVANQAQATAQNPAVQQDMRQAADTAAEGVSTAGLMGFFVLLAALCASIIGGATSLPRARTFQSSSDF